MEGIVHAERQLLEFLCKVQDLRALGHGFAQRVKKSSMRSRSAVEGLRRTSSRRISEFRQINRPATTATKISTKASAS
jgi:hypothetical protein